MTIRRSLATFVICSVIGMASSISDGRSDSGGRQKSYVDLYKVIKAIPWDASTQGPRIAVCQSVPDTGPTLEDLGRRRAHVGEVTAIVPVKMIILNTHFTDAPNLYDGLPRDAKILYLLTLLSDDQWQKISGDGLSISDCHGEQVAVMQSILPNPFKVMPVTVLTYRSYSADPSSAQQLSDQERLQVKLRIFKHIELTLPLANDRGFTGSTLRDNRADGSKAKMLFDDDGSVYGHRVKIESDNTLKKSQLDYHDPRLNAKIPLEDGERVSQLLERIQAACSINLYVDQHYANQRLIENGNEASARDMLEAVALGVCGTYRKVGDCYVLTLDLEGYGAHQTRLAVWEDENDKLCNERKDLWRSVVAKGRGFSKVKFNSAGYDQLSSGELDSLTANDRPDADEKYINTADASAAVRREVLEFKGGLDLDKAKVGLHSSTRYDFVLPDGSSLFGINWLDQTNRFSPNPYIWKPRKPDGTPLPMMVSPDLAGVVLHAERANVAVADVAQVHALGMKELWLETTSSAALQAAVDAAATVGVSVRLAVRPWVVWPNERVGEVDRNVLGDHGREFAEHMSEYNSLQKHYAETGAFQPATQEQLAPLSPEIDSHWAAIKQLGSVKGIAGVVLLDAFPRGYAKTLNRSSGSYFYSHATDMFLCYGYTEAQRLAFLKLHHSDPLDLDSDAVFLKGGIQDAWSSGWGDSRLYLAWQEARGQWIHDTILNLLNLVSDAGAPILAAPQPPKSNLPPYAQNGLFVWKKGADVPVAPEDYVGRQVVKDCDEVVVNIEATDDIDQRLRVGAIVVKLIQNSHKPVVLDFSDVPLNKLEGTLKAWLVKSP